MDDKLMPAFAKEWGERTARGDLGLTFPIFYEKEKMPRAKPPTRYSERL